MKLHKSILLSLVALFTLLTAGFFSIEASAKAKADIDTSSTDNITYSQIYTTAKSKLGSPYIWGATGPTGFDCSGFTSYVYKQSGVTIARTAQAQYNTNKHVAYKNIQKGDLVFFGGNAASISHVGMYIGGGKMIDAQNRGVITENVKAPWWHYVGSAHVTDLD
ncbi:C40 family peptidase [Lentilactobacillus kosonis]|uniref:NlpC/P60 domain-containing protein n=1 Tax=Lentilactobacillus kosonis TaxID=2810561 RepID=A0A401FIE2_9LACO|nr:C40 family peptidase [Lentilactobacillus kosonis]GAY72124.1 hypothetical protein NBRC111893_270 [Lentilactobacillus kosonis]